MAETVLGLETVGDALRRGAQALTVAGCDTPRLDAELLLAEVLGVDRAGLVIDRDVAVCQPARDEFAVLLARRVAREPVAYILGRREFRRLCIGVDRRVLIPRPETELLVEVGLGLGSGQSVVDVGTGSGAVALALKDERPDLVVRGLDVDVDAIDLARANAARLGLDVEFDVADLLDGDGLRYDAVLANLPYVEDGAVLAPEIARWEPASALYGGGDGLDLVRALVAQVDAAPSLLALEIAPDQASVVADLVRSAGFESVDVLRDLAGHDRVVVGRA